MRTEGISSVRMLYQKEQFFMQRPVGNDFFGWIAYLLDSYGSLFLQGAGYTMLIAISGTVLGFLLGNGFQNSLGGFIWDFQKAPWRSAPKVAFCLELTDTEGHRDLRELIRVNEALHEKKIAEIADQIYQRMDKVRVVLIAGPSSSGKTSFANRLSIQLKALGVKPHKVSLDDYFLNRDDTPVDENGKKLSKREHAHSIRQDKEQGVSAEQLLGRVLFKAKLQPESTPISLEQAISLVAEKL